MEGLKTLKDFERKAVDELMNDYSRLYFSAGAGYRTTPSFNEDAFQKYFIKPRMLRNVTNATMSCQILNVETRCPIGVSPTALHTLAHSRGEIASAAGSSAEGCIFIMSSGSGKTIEDVAKHVNCGCRWLQMYMSSDREIILDLIKKAELHGFSALVVTVDLPVSGLFREFLQDDFCDQEAFRISDNPTSPTSRLNKVVTFEELKWLKQNTRLPIVAKGILSGEDAVKAIHAGASAILVSNHGGRLIQRVVPTIHVLEEVVIAVKDMGVDVYIDGGVRSGTDVFVALALGAKAVFIGRPVIWGLSVNGEKGVRKVLSILKEEFFRTMQLAGAARIEDIERSMVEKII